MEENKEEACSNLPEILVRRPDPCIYSQSYLRAQDLPVTWNNPDIWMAPASDPTAIEADSYHLRADTDYIVFVQVHNASLDPAIGVKVRLLYRPWSFNSPDLLPVQTDGSGNEVFRSVNVGAMGATVTQFLWRTPAVQAGQQAHYCIQAHLSHPMDLNPANNIGQENTNVIGEETAARTRSVAAADALTTIEVPLFNLGRRARNFRFHFDTYSIDKNNECPLTLQTTCGKAKMSLGDRLGQIMPTVSPSYVALSELQEASAISKRRPAAFGKVNFGSPKSRYKISKGKYVGFEKLRKKIKSGDYSLPENMDIELDQETIQLAPNESHIVKIKVKIPPGAERPDALPLNIIAETDTGEMRGGVTILL